MRLTWYGHSCFLLETDSGSVVLDPYAPGSVPGLTLPPLEADAVICSHDHRDHGYAQGVRLSGREPGFGLLRLETFHDGLGGAKRGGNLITLIDAEGLRLLHLGDLGHELDAGQVAALGRVDVLLVPVGGFYTIDAAQAAATVRALRPRVTVPMHYCGEGFGYGEIAPAEDFLALCDNVRRLDANTLELSAPCESFTALLKCPVS